MKLNNIKNIAKNMRKDGKLYGDIAVALNITRQSARHLQKSNYYEAKDLRFQCVPITCGNWDY